MTDILKILKGYRTRYSFNDGDSLELVDMLCPDDAEEITDGKLELEALAEYLYDELPALNNDGWTYCDDKMPEDGSSVNVTVVSSTTQLRFVLTLDWEDEHWVYEDYNHASFWQPIPDDWKVIAWRRKPDPAKGRDV